MTDERDALLKNVEAMAEALMQPIPPQVANDAFGLAAQAIRDLVAALRLMERER
jgi:hypothetical protein